jgi:hypothetical protein
MLYFDFEAEEPRQTLCDRRQAIGRRTCTVKHSMLSGDIFFNRAYPQLFGNIFTFTLHGLINPLQAQWRQPHIPATPFTRTFHLKDGARPAPLTATLSGSTSYAQSNHCVSSIALTPSSMVLMIQLVTPDGQSF